MENIFSDAFQCQNNQSLFQSICGPKNITIRINKVVFQKIHKKQIHFQTKFSQKFSEKFGSPQNLEILEISEILLTRHIYAIRIC